METPTKSWHERWREARKRWYSMPEKLIDALHEADPALDPRHPARSTVLAWEGVPWKKRAYPSAKFRSTLVGLRPEFAALIAEVEEAERAKGAAARTDLHPPGLGELAETVTRLSDQMVQTIDALTLLANEQPQPLRDQLLRALAGETP